MKRKILSLALCAALFSAALCTGVQATGMGEFRKQRMYAGQFYDITGKWHETYIADLYEYGLAEGMDETTMAPEEPVTVAQVIALAARINAKYYDGHIGEAGSGKWYEPYISYAYDYGLIDRKSEVEPERPATRGESVLIFSHALPDWQLDAVNAAKKFDDVWDEAVPTDVTLSNAVTLLYRAGVINGYEDELFRPDGEISRAEALTIADRIVNKSQRRGYNEFFAGAANPGEDGPTDNKWYASDASGTFMLEKIAMINADVEKGYFMMAVTAEYDGGMVTMSGACETKWDAKGNILMVCVIQDRVAQGGTNMYVAKEAENLGTLIFTYDGNRGLKLTEVITAIDKRIINSSNAVGTEPVRVVGMLCIGMTLKLVN